MSCESDPVEFVVVSDDATTRHRDIAKSRIKTLYTFFSYFRALSRTLVARTTRVCDRRVLPRSSSNACEGGRKKRETRGDTRSVGVPCDFVREFAEEKQFSTTTSAPGRKLTSGRYLSTDRVCLSPSRFLSVRPSSSDYPPRLCYSSWYSNNIVSRAHCGLAGAAATAEREEVKQRAPFYLHQRRR